VDALDEPNPQAEAGFDYATLDEDKHEDVLAQRDATREYHRRGREGGMGGFGTSWGATARRRGILPRLGHRRDLGAGRVWRDNPLLRTPEGRDRQHQKWLVLTMRGGPRWCRVGVTWMASTV
jgi:hypothetical protein